MGTSWRSRSRAVELDTTARRFRYRSCTDDGNPSFGDWTWTVDDHGKGGCRVVVGWALEPRTFWRRVMMARVRNRLLRREITASLEALKGRAVTVSEPR